MEFKKKIVRSLALIMASTAILSGCNLFSSVDKSKSDEEILSEARARMDRKDFSGAETILKEANIASDRAYSLLGWAQLGIARADFENITKTLFAYNSTGSNPYTIIGSLAKSLMPASSFNVSQADIAASTFAKIKDSNEKSLMMTLSYLVKAAAILAKNGVSGNLGRAQISSSSCLNATCSSAPAACDQGTGQLNNDDANAFGQAMVDAATQTSAGSGLGVIGSLSSDIKNAVSASTPRITRCTIYNQLFTE